jgi:hypothetical protein
MRVLGSCFLHSCNELMCIHNTCITVNRFKSRGVDLAKVPIPTLFICDQGTYERSEYETLSSTSSGKVQIVSGAKGWSGLWLQV